MEVISKHQAFDLAIWVLRTEERCELAEEVLNVPRLMDEFESLHRHFTKDYHNLSHSAVSRWKRTLRNSIEEFIDSQNFQLEQPEAMKVTV